VNVVQHKSERSSKIFLQEPVRLATAQRHDDLRRQLLAAAEAFIEANGLAELRARTLAQTVGCSVGAIYNVFPDLDALILAVNAATLEDIGRHMSTIQAGTPAQQFASLAAAYLAYATTNRRRWDALFTHRMPETSETPGWFMQTQEAAFSHIEAPLKQLRPDLPQHELTLLARSIFAAVHGIVAFGLEHRTGPIDLPALATQLTTVAEALAVGLGKKGQGALPPAPPAKAEPLQSDSGR
jgi:AcrR family transcriptional regulator